MGRPTPVFQSKLFRVIQLKMERPIVKTINPAEAVAEYWRLEERIVGLDAEVAPLFREERELADKLKNLQSYRKRLEDEKAVAMDRQRSISRRYESYLERTGIRTYKMRLNCFSDIEEFQKAMKQRGYTYQEPLDDCNKNSMETETYTFVSPHSLDELLVVLDTIVDGHIMEETLQYEEDYTGVRTYKMRLKSKAL